MYGEQVVFTGRLSISRRAAAQAAAQAGCKVHPRLTYGMTILVVGEQVQGRDKSSKQRRAEKMIAEGCTVQVMTGADFLAACRSV